MGRWHTEAIGEEGFGAWFMGRTARQRAAKDAARRDLRRTNHDLSRQLGMSAAAGWTWLALVPVGLVLGWWIGRLWGIALALWLLWGLSALLRWRHRRARAPHLAAPQAAPEAARGPAQGGAPPPAPAAAAPAVSVGGSAPAASARSWDARAAEVGSTAVPPPPVQATAGVAHVPPPPPLARPPRGTG